MEASRFFNEKYEINRNRELKQWFKTYYIKWLETCDNQRWIVKGRTAKHPTCLMPFLPFGQVPALPYNYWLTKFIDTQICLEGDRVPPDNDYGQPGHMFSVIKENDWNKKQPFIMFEKVDGGIVTDYVLYRDVTLEYVENEVFKEYGISSNIVYRKHVTTDYLAQIYQLHKDWQLHGDNALYLIEFFKALIQALHDGNAGIDIKPKLLENIWKIVVDSIHLEGLDIWGIAKRMTGWFPNIEVQVRGESFPIDLGGQYTLIIEEQAIWTFLDGVKSRNNLSDLFFFLISFLGQGLRTGWIKLEGVAWMSRISAFFLRRRVKTLPQKVQIISKIMADPFRVLVIADQKAVLMELVNGLPKEISFLELNYERKEDSEIRPATLQELWLEAIGTYPGTEERDRFIHLAVQVNQSGPKNSFALQPFGFSIQDQMEIYPQNDFVKYLVRKGVLQVAFLILPLLKA